MRAFVVQRYKGPLLETEVTEPTVGERDVLVRVEAAGLNELDEKIRAGEFKRLLRYELPLILGNDVAGTILSVGPKVVKFKPGDEVYGRPDLNRIGTFAERIALDEADLAPKPASISMVEAGSLPLVALTAWQALVERGNVQPGQKVLIHGGAGGVGSIAIQLARSKYKAHASPGPFHGWTTFSASQLAIPCPTTSARSTAPRHGGPSAHAVASSSM